MPDEIDDLVPQKQSLFPMTADDIVDNALQNLDEQQAREVTKKAETATGTTSVEIKQSKSNRLILMVAVALALLLVLILLISRL